MHEEFNKMPEFFMIFARKINKIPECYTIFARKVFFPIFFGGGGDKCPPVSRLRRLWIELN